MSTDNKKRRGRLVFLATVAGLAALLATPYARRPAEAEAHKVDRFIEESVLPPATDTLRGTTFVVFDTETSGIDPNYAKVVEIAAVKFRDGKVLDEKGWLVNPGQYIPPVVQGVHGITPDMVEKSPPFCDIYLEFLDFCKDAVLIGHNAMFDVRFLEMESTACGFTVPPNSVFDSMKLSRKIYPGLESYRLNVLAKHTNVELEGEFHRAGVDCLYVAEILFQIFDKIGWDTTLTELYDLASSEGGETEGGEITFATWVFADDASSRPQPQGQ